MNNNAVMCHDVARDPTSSCDSLYRSFLQAFVAHGGVDDYFARTLDQAGFKDFSELLGAASTRAHTCHRCDSDLDLEPSVLYVPHQDQAAPLTWQRQDEACSLCIQIMGTMSPATIKVIQDLMIAPTSPWDTLVCRSQTQKAIVLGMMAGFAAYLEKRVGGHLEFLQGVLPDVAVIARGIDVSAQTTGETEPIDRATLRTALGIEDTDIAVLGYGALDFSPMFNPTSLLLALQSAVEGLSTDNNRVVHLVLAGWFADQKNERVLRQAVKSISPSINLILVNGKDTDVQKRIWRAADIFVSIVIELSDQADAPIIQAMAAGLPIICSDWGSQGELFDHNEQGFLIPLWMPYTDKSTESKLINNNAVVDAVVDAGALMSALRVLVEDDDKRIAMGQAARVHAEQTYDWKVVIPQYQQLWADQEARRMTGEADGENDSENTSKSTTLPKLYPASSQPPHYATHHIGLNTQVHINDGISKKQMTVRLNVSLQAADINSNAKLGYKLEREQCFVLMTALAENRGMTLQDLALVLPDQQYDDVVKIVTWLAQTHLVRLSGTAHLATIPQQITAQPDQDTAQIAELRYIVSQYPEDPSCHINLGKALIEAGMQDEGVHSLRAAVRLVPDDADLCFQLGLALRRIGVTTDAIQHLKSAITLDNDHLAARYHLALIMEKTGEIDTATTLLREIEQVAPKDSAVQAALSSINIANANATNVENVAIYCQNTGEYAAFKELFPALQDTFNPLISFDIQQITERNPRAVLCSRHALARIKAVLPEAYLVMVPDQPPLQIASRYKNDETLHYADAICAVDALDLGTWINSGIEPEKVWLTGLPALDPVFNDTLNREAELNRGLPDNLNILLVPNWYPGPCDQVLYEYCDPTDQSPLQVMLLDPSEDFAVSWQNFADTHDNVALMTNQSARLIEELAETSLLVSGYTAASIAYLAFDKPLVLIVDFDKHDLESFDDLEDDESNESGAEITDVRSIGCTLRSVAHFLSANDTSLDDCMETMDQARSSSQPLSEARARARLSVYELSMDGKSAQRIADALIKSLS